jgi:hypothetical protein
MTQAQRDLINNPAMGLMIFQTDNTPGYYFYNGNAWTQLATGSTNNLWSANGNNIYNNTGNNVGIGTNVPFAKLTVSSGDVYGIVHTNGTVSMGTYIGNNGLAGLIGLYGGWLGTQSNHPLHFFY